MGEGMEWSLENKWEAKFKHFKMETPQPPEFLFKGKRIKLAFRAPQKQYLNCLFYVHNEDFPLLMNFKAAFKMFIGKEEIMKIEGQLQSGFGQRYMLSARNEKLPQYFLQNLSFSAKLSYSESPSKFAIEPKVNINYPPPTPPQRYKLDTKKPQNPPSKRVETPKPPTRPNIPNGGNRNYVGLDGGNNRCYANAVIQVLYHLPIFRNFVLGCNCQSQSVLQNLRNVFQELDKRNQTNTTAIIRKLYPNDSNRQQDCDEFMQAIFTDIDNEVKNPDPLEFMRGLISVNGGYQSEPFLTLPLPIAHADTLDSAFADFQVVDNNHSLNFTCVPDVLFIQLKRFTQNGNQIAKDNKMLHYPMNLTRQLFPVKSNYTLFAVILHSGSVLSGHYTSCINPDLDKWMIFDDGKVEELRVDVLGWKGSADSYEKSAYILVYVKDDARNRIFCKTDH